MNRIVPGWKKAILTPPAREPTTARCRGPEHYWVIAKAAKGHHRWHLHGPAQNEGACCPGCPGHPCGWRQGGLRGSQYPIWRTAADEVAGVAPPGTMRTGSHLNQLQNKWLLPTARWKSKHGIPVHLRLRPIACPSSAMTSEQAGVLQVNMMRYTCYLIRGLILWPLCPPRHWHYYHS